MIVSIVGLGLVGGSAGLILKKKGFASKIIGVDTNKVHEAEAINLNLVDECHSLDSALQLADLVILAMPVDQIETQVSRILDQISKDTVVVDFGSTKERICGAVKDHPNRAQFVAAHPIAGTEDSGPQASFLQLYEGKTGIICDKELSSESAFKLAKQMMKLLGMQMIEMDSRDHDLHIAYVSHLSHISSFILGQTVLEIEQDEASIFNLAGSGFESTVRLAKSSPQMWSPIFLQNRQHVSDALAAYIDNLVHFKNCIDKNLEKEMVDCMQNANDIRRILNGINKKTTDDSRATSLLTDVETRNQEKEIV